MPNMLKIEFYRTLKYHIFNNLEIFDIFAIEYRKNPKIFSDIYKVEFYTKSDKLKEIIDNIYEDHKYNKDAIVSLAQRTIKFFIKNEFDMSKDLIPIESNLVN